LTSSIWYGWGLITGAIVTTLGIWGDTSPLLTLGVLGSFGALNLAVGLLPLWWKR
jgi:hypothetical protein